MTRRRFGGGVNWAKKASAAHRHIANMRETDERDVGGQRVDLAALLAEPIGDFAAYDLDHELAVHDFRARAHRWLTRAA